MILLSFVIPCYRSEHTIVKVIDEIKQTVAQDGLYCYEIIAVNDCSPDNVYGVLEGIAQKDVNVKVINFAKNMGKHSAVMAGYAAANGEYIVNLDDDFQCPVNRLWELMAPLEKGYDVSMARYDTKKQTGFKNFGSAVNGLMSRILIGKPKDLQINNFSVMKRFVVEEIVRYKNPYPYLEGLILRTTGSIAMVDMEERERADNARSGYTIGRSLNLWLNGFTAFSVKPLRIATITGTVSAGLGFIYGIALIIKKLISPSVPVGYSSTMATLLLIGGLILLVLGLIGEYVGRIYICLNASPQYVIRNTINCDKKKSDGVSDEDN